ncbi:maleylpyruvate isomerase N-terminal domain-containing protein [Actinoplanes philippinensis]|uniref:maleylpyruvate isomerase N-terminal domain-containing protein n=1 Tax=Actinoplanes philippinensis TaxID=35752 RepID=UPI0033D86BCC
MNDRTPVAFTAEAAAFAAALRQLPADAWRAPTRCVPWQVSDLIGHVITAVSRTPAMIAAPAPDHADTTATGYYRADKRFSDSANADRVQTAQQRAATGWTPALLLRKTTGRAPVTAAETRMLDGLGLRSLALA